MNAAAPAPCVYPTSQEGPRQGGVRTIHTPPPPPRGSGVLPPGEPSCLQFCLYLLSPVQSKIPAPQCAPPTRRSNQPRLALELDKGAQWETIPLSNTWAGRGWGWEGYSAVPRGISASSRTAGGGRRASLAGSFPALAAAGTGPPTHPLPQAQMLASLLLFWLRDSACRMGGGNCSRRTPGGPWLRPGLWRLRWVCKRPCRRRVGNFHLNVSPPGFVWFPPKHQISCAGNRQVGARLNAASRHPRGTFSL